VLVAARAESTARPSFAAANASTTATHHWQSAGNIRMGLGASVSGSAYYEGGDAKVRERIRVRPEVRNIREG